MHLNISCIFVNDAKEKANLILYYQVNCAWFVNHTRSQSIDLGIHTEACMTRPETCGAAGGAISVWVNAIECVSDRGGIVSSRSSSSSGSIIYCTSTGKTVYDFSTNHFFKNHLGDIYKSFGVGWGGALIPLFLDFW